MPSHGPIAWQYFRRTSEWDTGAIHLGIRNDSDQDIVISSLRIDGKPQPWAEDLPAPQREIEASQKEDTRWYFPPAVQAGDVMWFRFSRKVVPPQGLTELIIKFQSPPARPVALELDTTAGALVRTTVEVHPPPISITAIAFSADLLKTYVYIHNAGPHEQRLEAVELNGEDRTADAVFVNRWLSPRMSGCIIIPARRSFTQGDYVYVRVQTRDGTVTGNGIRAFSPFILPGRRGDVVLRRFSENPYGQLDLVARATLQKEPALQGQDMVVYWSNQGFLKYGIMAFGELVDCAQVHCQPAEVEYLGKYRPQDPHYVQAKVRYLRAALAPRPLFAQMEIHHALMGSDLQGLLSPVELRLRVYYMISRGVKGVSYRGRLEDKSTASQRTMLQEEMDRIADELTRLTPLLRVAEDVEGLRTCSEPLVEPNVLLCGDEAMVVVLLNHDRQMSWPRNEMYLGESFRIAPKPRPFTVDLHLPAEVNVVDVVEVGGKWSHPEFEVRNHLCRLTIDGIVDTRIVVIGLGGTVARNLLAQPIHALFQGSVAPRPSPAVDDVNSVIDALGPIVIPGERTGPWNPPKLAQLAADDQGPHVQFEEKQYYFGQVPPDQWYWHSFYYRNIGNRPLEVTPYAVPGDVKLVIDKDVLGPGDRSCIHVGFYPSAGRMHRVIQLKTNDSNEKRSRLEIGGDCAPLVRSIPDHVQFTVDPLHQDSRRQTIRLVRNGKGDLDIHSIEPSSERIRCDLIPGDNNRIVTRSHADIFEGEYVQQERVIAVSVKEDGIRATTQEYITVTTGQAGALRIPVTIQVVDPVLCSQRQLFFGTVKDQASRSLRIMSRGSPFRVQKVYADNPNIRMATCEIQAENIYEVTASITSADQKGVTQGEIRIVLNCGGQAYSLAVPFYALIQ